MSTRCSSRLLKARVFSWWSDPATFRTYCHTLVDMCRLVTSNTSTPLHSIPLQRARHQEFHECGLETSIHEVTRRPVVARVTERRKHRSPQVMNPKSLSLSTSPRLLVSEQNRETTGWRARFGAPKCRPSSSFSLRSEHVDLIYSFRLLYKMGRGLKFRKIRMFAMCMFPRTRSTS